LSGRRGHQRELPGALLGAVVAFLAALVAWKLTH
jgi:hypothetical protein